MKVKVEFSGGLELLFDKATRLTVDVDEKTTIKDLIAYLKQNHLKEKPELFMSGDSVRPGILVLVNDVDWELLDGADYKVEPNDNVVFISTLHGG
ncbi:ubiquitin related modifier 1 [Acrasis kona]|uniref:Ubiquitin-related modifier 1 homolog n=1 Tax=Acrasis kona TaxID=1008807 RepID=A0AAW2YPN7_9EUKA